MKATKRIAFLYNHEGIHQVRHSAAVIPKLVASYPSIKVTVLATSDALMDAVRVVCGPDVAALCVFQKLEIPAWQGAVAGVADLALPFSRFAYLRANRAVFQPFDVLVVTEGTSLHLKTYPELAHLKVVRVDHGAGDRSIGFTKAFTGNDLVLVAGEKQRDRFLELGLLKPEQIGVVGYTKFDTVDVATGRRRKFFGNSKPVVLYNPHPEPYLSSWYDMGLDVLDYFYNNSDFNLIFAPHVMLFKRRMHLSVEHHQIRFRRALPEKYRQCPHMLIDTGSAASVDMTYTLAADIYLGDASSQVYEFLVEPRPCIFLNTHGAAWQNDPDYGHWRFGPVAESVAALDGFLKTAAADHARYRPIQEEVFRKTFDLQDTPSSQRAADAIAKLAAT